MKILICGLPGAGKTTLAKVLYKHLDNCEWFNADEVRKQSNDWDFTSEGRMRQVSRMKALADGSLSAGAEYVICDFVAPTEEMRQVFNADFTVWVDRISTGRFEDTNKVFERPTKWDVVISAGMTVSQSVGEVLSKLATATSPWKSITYIRNNNNG